MLSRHIRQRRIVEPHQGHGLGCLPVGIGGGEPFLPLHRDNARRVSRRAWSIRFSTSTRKGAETIMLGSSGVLAKRSHPATLGHGSGRAAPLSAAATTFTGVPFGASAPGHPGGAAANPIQLSSDKSSSPPPPSSPSTVAGVLTVQIAVGGLHREQIHTSAECPSPPTRSAQLSSKAALVGKPGVPLR